MSPIFGTMIQSKNRVFMCTVGHAIDQRDEGLSVWTGVHPEVAKSSPYGVTSNAELLIDIRKDRYSNMIIDDFHDIMAIPIANYEGHALDFEKDMLQDNINVLDPALISFLDYEPDASGVLRKVNDGIAGLISVETENHCVISIQGAPGLSGAPAFLAHPEGLLWFGIYTGTSPRTPLTNDAVINNARIIKANRFLSNL
ncbi:hypothetical protein JKG47_11390 [Acidithiobacillus sp. MC6.1]|nr:hypothetical protein [Acidithiobacillus sp. MC6.1]